MTRCFAWLVVALLAVACSAEDNSFESCLRRDSISCVQIHVYRKLRALFAQDNINLLAGFQLTKSEEGRSASSDPSIDQEIFGENTVSERQSSLEDYIFDKITNFFKERSFRWNLTPAIEQVSSTARLALDSIPQDLKEQTANYISEARGRRRGLLKSLIPILLAAKLKLVGFFSLMYVVTALIAKKALIASVIALAITIFISVKKIMAKHYHHYPYHYEVHEPYHGPPVHHPASSGWSHSGWSGWDSYDLHGAHSSPVGHHLAYSAQKPTHR